jgi:hypothetical protein
MIKTFLKHEFKAFWRSKNAGKSLAIRIVMALLILLLMLYVVAAGFFMGPILKKVFPHDSIIFSFCGFVLVYFVFDLFSRIQLQELPTLRVQPYLQLPIKRNAIVGYLTFTGLFSVFNLWPVLLFWPFIFRHLLPASGNLASFSFIVAIFGLSIFNNYLALYLKRKSNLNGWIFLLITAVMILLIMGDLEWHLYSIRNISYLFFGNVLKYPMLSIVPLVLGGAMFYINFLYLKQNLYLEELRARKEKFKSSTDFPILSYFGPVGDLVANEVKLILRNKRPRSALVMSLLFMFYGLIFYSNPGMKNSEGLKVFAGMFMTGIFMINYGQFMYSWQASHFDGLMVSKISFSDFLKAKYLMFSTAATTAFILTTPYVYFGWRVLVIHLMMYLWNMGVTTTIVLYFANRNARRIDLGKGASFNWEGVGASQWILSLVLMLPPFVIYIPLKMLGLTEVALTALGAIGLIGILTRSFWIKILEADFHKRKFSILEGFRNK